MYNGLKMEKSTIEIKVLGQTQFVSLKFGIFGGFGLGVKVRNMKIDFNTGGTWHRVGQ